jgi:hypothetical protein
MLPPRIFLACPVTKLHNTSCLLCNMQSLYNSTVFFFTNVTMCVGSPQNYYKICDLHSVLGGQVNNLNVFVHSRGPQTQINYAARCA